MLKQISVFYETPNVSEKYFQEKVKNVGKIFGARKTKFFSIDRVKNLTLPSYSNYPRIVITNNNISADGVSRVFLDGVGLSSNNLAYLKFQETSLLDTLYLMTHEMGHIFGLAHCQSEKCVMGVYFEGGKVKNAWREVAESRRFSKNIFCRDCLELLSSWHSTR